MNEWLEAGGIRFQGELGEVGQQAGTSGIFAGAGWAEEGPVREWGVEGRQQEAGCPSHSSWSSFAISSELLLLLRPVLLCPWSGLSCLLPARSCSLGSVLHQPCTRICPYRVHSANA